ncbi:hypothetical protein [Duganella aceris]|uniref:CN hydrolase domain-containing protein n=1 Tax=Duganella aceris TaxID=2703883 RepID=A0ABX0FUG0_9BURK|nr:hypothetical protein [Duganella aceris]NGZ88344.1 hypothetical protein [Duganella aceris]
MHDAQGRVIVAPERDLKNVAHVYCENSDIAERTAGDQKYGVRPWAADSALAERLWRLSAAMAG